MKVEHLDVSLLPLLHALVDRLHKLVLKLRHSVGHLFLESGVLRASFQVLFEQLRNDAEGA